jgi:hypothetical protein
MPEEEKEHVVTRVSEICAEIKVFRSSDLTGVDYNWLDPLQEPGDQKVEVLQQHCKELGMDCSVFILSHNDLGPTNIIINGNRIVVLDWEMAGCQEAIAQSSSLSSGDVGRFIMSSSNALLLRWLSTRISDGVWPGAYSLAASPYMSNRLSMRH